MLIFKKLKTVAFLSLLSIVFFCSNPVIAQIPGVECSMGIQTSGAIYQICVPSANWNGDLVVYAQGFVSPLEELQLPPEAAEFMPYFASQGFAFATTSFSVNGMTAIKAGVGDLVELVDLFNAAGYGVANHVYLAGISLGGCTVVKCVEEHGDVFDGALALSGVYGDILKQVNYMGDFRTVFNYFFPDVIPGETTEIPQYVIDNWETMYAPLVMQAVIQNQDATRQLLKVTKVTVDKNDPDMVMEAIISLLWYNIVSINDLVERIGGNIYDNHRKFYFGSDNDWRLNRKIKRYRADEEALEQQVYYQTTGKLESPLVTMHTTGDYIVPFWHQFLYRIKALRAGCYRKYTGIPIVRYGHITFEMEEIAGAFSLLVMKVTGQELLGDLILNMRGTLKANFSEMAKKHIVIVPPGK